MGSTLSIIVPCLNEAPGIAAALDCLRPLRARGVEVIVVDGGSSDGTARLAASRADRLIVAGPGRASQMNAGAAIARGTILLFLHADCRLPADADRLIIDGLAAHARLWGRFDVGFDGAQPFMRIIAFMMNLRSRLTRIATGDQAIFITRELFFARGGYPPIALMEDVALCKRVKRGHPPLCLAARVTASARRWERHGMLRTVLLMWLLRLAFCFGVDPARLALRYDNVRAGD